MLLGQHVIWGNGLKCLRGFTAVDKNVESRAESVEFEYNQVGSSWACLFYDSLAALVGVVYNAFGCH